MRIGERQRSLVGSIIPKVNVVKRGYKYEKTTLLNYWSYPMAFVHPKDGCLTWFLMVRFISLIKV